MKIAVSTSGIVRFGNEKNDLSMIREAGFDGIDLSFASLCGHWGDMEEYKTSLFWKPIEEVEQYYLEFADICNDLGLSIVQSHAPWSCYFSGNKEANTFLLDAIKKCILVCGKINCKYIVVHPFWGVQREVRESIEINRELFLNLMDTAKENGVEICIENLFGFENGRILEEPFANAYFARDFIDDLNEKAGEKVFGFCLDVGHANILSKNIYEFITTMGNRLSVLHVHGNDGVGDQHLVPYLSSSDLWGDVSATNWEDFIKGIKEIGYEGDLNLELAIGMIPKELLPSYLGFSATVGKYFRSRIRTE